MTAPSPSLTEAEFKRQLEWARWRFYRAPTPEESDRAWDEWKALLDNYYHSDAA